MARLDFFTGEGAVNSPAHIRPANNGSFPLIDAHDVQVGSNPTDANDRLDATLEGIDTAIDNINSEIGTGSSDTSATIKKRLAAAETNIGNKVNTSDIQTTVRAAASASDSKVVSEKAVRSAIDNATVSTTDTPTSGSAAAFSAGGAYTELAKKVNTNDIQGTVNTSSNPPSSNAVKTYVDAADDLKVNTSDIQTTVRAAASASDNKIPSEKAVRSAIDNATVSTTATPASGSAAAFSAGGAYTELAKKVNVNDVQSSVNTSANPVSSNAVKTYVDAAAAGNLGGMQAQYAEFVADAEDVLNRAASLSNGMVACSDIAAETTVGDTRILLYTGTTNANYTNGHWYYNSAPSNQAPSWTDGGAVGSAPTIDNTLTTAGAAADSKSVGDAIKNIVTISDTQPGSNSGNKVWIRETTDKEVQIPTYQEHISKANKADLTTNNESDNGSGTITASKAYAIGDHFYINNTNTSSENYGVSTLYKATAAIASGDAIVVGTNCEASKVADEITSLSNDIDNVRADLGAFTGYSSIPVTGTGYIVLSGDTADINSPVTNTNYRYSVYPCSEGDTFTVNATGASKGRAWGFIDANGNVLSKSNANVTVTGLVLTAPTSSAYIVINNSSSSTSYVGDVKSNSDLNTEISVAQKKGLTGDYVQAERITSNSDLNDYTQAGNYKITTDTEAATIANLPSNMTRGRLFVMQPYNADRVIQMFFSGSTGRIFVRRYTTSWSDWTRLFDVTLSALDDQSNLPVNSNAVIKGMQDFTADATNTMHLGYSWWVNNRAVDTYGNLYFGYISEDSKCGVCCRFPDGSILRHDLYQSKENDDHNAPSVIIITQDGQEYVCVLGSTGHNTDNRMHCYLATEPNTVNCTFMDKTTTVDPPEGYQYQCTYSQAYFDTYKSSGVTYNRITNFFRIRQRVLGQSHPYHMVWVCAISDDYGDTWKFYSVFAVDEEDTLFYMRGADTTSPYLKRIVLQPNTALRNYKPIKTGHVNLSTGNILTGGTKIGTLLEFGSTRLAYDENTLQYDEFETVVQNETDYLYRILDVWEAAPGDLVFIYARTTVPIDTTITNAYRFVNDWTVYRYNKGVTTEVAHLGAAFFKASHYVTGACFYNDIDHVIYSQNNSEFETVTIDGVQKSRQLQDGAHSLHIVEISNNAVTSDKVIKTSRQTIARPLRYDDSGVMMLVGQYREGKGTAFLTWHFGIQFLDVIN